MKRNNVMRKMLSVMLIAVMIVGLTSVGEPTRQVQAAETVDIYSEDFETGAVLGRRGTAGSGSHANQVETEKNLYLKLTSFTSSQVVTPGISVEANTEYILSYRVKVANVSGNFYFYSLGQEWNDSNEYNSLSAIADATRKATDDWQTVEGLYTSSKNHVQFFFEEAWGGSADICLDDITLKNKTTGEIVYQESFDTTEALTVRSGAPTQSQEQEELSDYYMQITGAQGGYRLVTGAISVDSDVTYTLSYRYKVTNVSGNIYFYGLSQEWDDNNAYTSANKLTSSVKAATDGWQVLEVSYTPTSGKNHVQFFFEQADIGSADIALDDITLKRADTKEVVYSADFNAQQGLTVNASGTGGSYALVADGNHYLELQSVSNGYTVQTTEMKVEEGKQYILSYRVNMSNVSGSVYFYPWIQEWYADGNGASGYASNTGIAPSDCILRATTDGWITLEMPYACSTGKNRVQFYFEQAWGGDAEIWLDDIKLTEIVEETNEMETALSFNKVEEKTWYLDADNTSNVTGSYYFTTIKVDGMEQKIALEKNSTRFVIYEGFFTVYDATASVPQSSLEILEGTVLYQFDPNTSWSDPVSGGQEITITQDLKVEKIGDSWCTYDKEDDQTGEPVYINIDAGGSVPVPVSGTYEITRKEDASAFTSIPTEAGTYDISTLETSIGENTLGYGSVEADAEKPDVTLSLKKADDTSWQFNTTGELSATDSIRYYKMPAVIDGVQTNVLVEIPSNQTYFEIYTNSHFGVYGGTIPNSSIEIPAGTVLNRVDSTTLQEVTGGDSIHVTQDFRVEITKTLICKRVVLYITGDANADNTINIKDLVAMKHIAEKSSSATTSSAGIKAADVNTSGIVDDIDLLALRRTLIEVENLSKTKADALLNGVMPIIGYDGPDYDENRSAAGYEADFVTEDVYRLIKEVGINTVVANRNEVGTNLNLATKTLKYAQANGIKVYLNNAYVSDTANGAYSDSPTVDLNAITETYAKYSSFAGYYVYDEPYKAKVPTFGDSDRKVIADFNNPLSLLKNYANISGYMNLFPCISTTLMWELDTNITNATIKESNYKAYLTAASQAGVDYISYDLYLRGNDYENEKQGFYTNLEWANAVAKDEGKPFYAFIQVGTDFEDDNSGSTSQSNLTTVQEMYLEANAALAMGARGLNYYSLIQPLSFAQNSDGSVDLYRSGLINLEGKANNGAGGANYEYYNAAKKINTYVAKIDDVLMNADYQGVISTDSSVQGYLGSEITSYESLTEVTGSTSALVGCFDYYGKEAYMVVNTSCDGGGTGSQQTITLKFKDTVSYTTTGMDCAASSDSGKELSLTIDAGESALVVLD